MPIEGSDASREIFLQTYLPRTLDASAADNTVAAATRATARILVIETIVKVELNCLSRNESSARCNSDKDINYENLVFCQSQRRQLFLAARGYPHIPPMRTPHLAIGRESARIFSPECFIFLHINSTTGRKEVRSSNCV